MAIGFMVLLVRKRPTRYKSYCQLPSFPFSRSSSSSSSDESESFSSLVSMFSLLIETTVLANKTKTNKTLTEERLSNSHGEETIKLE